MWTIRVMLVVNIEREARSTIIMEEKSETELVFKEMHSIIGECTP